MTRNFKTLEVGKYYVSEEEPNRIVYIDEIYSDGDLVGSDGRHYKPDGSHCYNDVSPLTTEVTLTITPVEPKKPREWWIVTIDGEVVSNFLNEKGSKWFVSQQSKPDDFEVVHMREVMEGEE